MLQCRILHNPVPYKKGFGLQWYFLLIASVAFVIAYYIYNATTPQFTLDFIGELQFKILTASQKALSTIPFIMASAEHSIQQSIYDLAKQGGFKGPKCDSHSGFNVWAEIKLEGREIKVDECYPSNEEVSNNLLYIFNEHINDYFALHPFVYIPGDYEYKLEGNIEITANAKEHVSAPISELGFAQIPDGLKGDMLKIPMKGAIDIETIRQYHPEVLEKYEGLCLKMGFEPYPKEVKECYITSGYRHPAYNKEIGGARNSEHQNARALDIFVGRDARKQLEWVKSASDIGFNGVGIYPNDEHIHIDLREENIFFIASRGKTIASFRSFEEMSKNIGGVA